MVRIAEQKHFTAHSAIVSLPLPAKVYLPLSQHIGKPCLPLVKAGDEVMTGQKIADVEAAVASPVHASVSGRVLAIEEWPHPVIGRCRAVVIESDGLDRKSEFSASVFCAPLPVPCTLSSDDIRRIAREAGIVGLGGAAFPSHLKLNPPKPVDTLIINGAECESYLTGDSRLMIEKAKEIVEGIGLAGRCLGVRHLFLAIEENKPEAITAMSAHLSDMPSDLPPITLIRLKPVYPQGGERQLIKKVLNREVPRGKIPFEIGVVVHNVATVFALYEAVCLNKPLTERVVTVSGSILAHPQNLRARIGTPLKALIDFCGPLSAEPAKVIVAGAMMGIAQYSLDAPVVKSTTGVVLLSSREARRYEEEACIRCGECVRECPAGLMPCLINLAAVKERWQDTRALGAADCIECGICSYVCPSRRRLTQSIKRAKREGER